MSTVVMLSLSALGCFFMDLVLPTTTPSRPPGIDSNFVIPSTSRPKRGQFIANRFMIFIKI